MEDLTPTQRKLLHILKQHTKPPSLRKLADQMRVSSRNSIVRHRDQLERKGYTQRNNTGKITLTRKAML
jgi:predicted ArsR family transcriptional regulator